MTQMVIDDPLCLKLDQARGVVTFYSSSGRVVGQFIPAETRPLLKPEDGCPDSEEEVRAAIADAIANPGEGRPLAEFWREMGRES